MKPSAPSATEFRIGEKVPGTNWVVRNVLGKGGMGVVLEVEKASGLRMAMKVVRPGFAQSEEFIGRFLEEVRLLARLRHPNIVEVTDCDTLADGSPYIMMERLQGRTLREALADKEIVFTAENVWNVLGQLCSALHCAHAAQPAIVHRDVKPGNVFLYDRKHFVASVKLIDFGISAALDERRATGAPMGTARYMAPEACRGDPPTPRVDIYALGLVVYEMLTRSWPWDLENHSAEAILDAHLNREPIPPSRRVGWIPASVDECLMRALAKDAARRPQDVLAFREGLGELPFVDDGSGHHRHEGITAPTAETLAHGRGGPRERVVRDLLWAPDTVPSEVLYVSAELDDTSGQRSASASRMPFGSSASVSLPRAQDASQRVARDENLDTPLSTASESGAPRSRLRARGPAIALGSLVVVATAVGYRSARHAMTEPTPAAASVPAKLFEMPVVERPMEASGELHDAPGELQASEAKGVARLETVAQTVATTTAKEESFREGSAIARPAVSKRARSKSDGLDASPPKLEPRADGPKAKRPLSDEDLLFVPVGAKQ
jgi:serine/threonine-protein kinase